MGMVDIKMFMSEIFKFKISDLKAQKDHFMDYETCISYKETPCIFPLTLKFKAIPLIYSTGNQTWPLSFFVPKHLFNED